VCTCHPSYAGSINSRLIVQARLGINMSPYLKITKTKRVGGMAQTLEHLLSLEFKPEYSQEKKKL
jgi:hypothetical protein